MTVKVTYRQGLQDAASYLEGTASDFQETLARLQKYKILNQNERTEIAVLVAKIAVLKGQALHIRNMI